MADEDERIIKTPNVGYVAHPGGLGCTMFEKMWENKDKLAQIDGLTGEKETYKSLLQRCVRTALKMRTKGVTPDDIINICSTTHMDTCVPYIAALFLGAKPSTLDPSFSLHDITYLLKQIKPKLIFASPDALENLEKALEETSLDSRIVVFGNASNHTPFSDFLQSHAAEDDFKPVPAKSLSNTALILFSSGTSGLPKGICLTHRGFILTSYQNGQVLNMTRVLSFASFLWISTIIFLVTTAFYGGCRVVVPGFDANTFWELLVNYKPSMLFLSPRYVSILTKLGRPATSKATGLKTVFVSGGHVSEELMKSLHQMVPAAAVVLGYAQTELNGLATLFRPNIPEEAAWAKQKLTSSGRALPGYTIKIVDPETEESLGPNQKGEIRVKSDLIMNGYYNLDSSDTWDSEGWLKTGDIAYYDEDHCFYVVDRIKEMFKCQSYHVAPATVEAVILQHPAVEEAVVIGIPHEEDENHPMALVVLSKEAQMVLPIEIEKFVEKRVSDVQRLRAGVKIISRIPRTPTGKIKRRDLKDQVLRGEI